MRPPLQVVFFIAERNKVLACHPQSANYSSSAAYGLECDVRSIRLRNLLVCVNLCCFHKVYVSQFRRSKFKENVFPALSMDFSVVNIRFEKTPCVFRYFSIYNYFTTIELLYIIFYLLNF